MGVEKEYLGDGRRTLLSPLYLIYDATRGIELSYQGCLDLPHRGSCIYPPRYSYTECMPRNAQRSVVEAPARPRIKSIVCIVTSCFLKSSTTG
jgi:hypothetical protein